MTPDLLPLLFVLLFPGLITLVAPWLRLLPTPYLVAAEVALAFVPALIWLWFYRRQDRTEKEPLVYVLTTFVAGALVTAAVGTPLVRLLFAGQDWPYQSTLILLAGSILIPGMLLEALKYLAVRYTVYLNPEFSEPLDGIVYTTAAGLGAAAAMNVSYVLAYGGVDPAVGAIHFSVQTMGQAAFAGITGYALGAMKFSGKPQQDGRTALALGAAALLNGLFFWAMMAVSQAGITYSPWRGLLVAAATAAAASWAVYRLMGRARTADGAGAEDAPTSVGPLPAWDRRVVLAAVLLLGLGLGLRQAVSAQSLTVSLPAGVTVSYPAGWRTATDEEGTWTAVNSRSGSVFSSSLFVMGAPASSVAAGPGSQAAPLPLADQATHHMLSTAGSLPFFREVSFQEEQMAGRDAVRITYLYVADPQAGLLSSNPVPVVVRGVRVYTISENRLIAVGLEAADAQWEQESRTFERLLARLAW